jgi:DNA-binding response OmpR family regulator
MSGFSTRRARSCGRRGNTLWRSSAEADRDVRTVVSSDKPEATAQPLRPAVLCIDDDPLVLHFYRGFLDRHGYRVLTATEGLQGLALAQRDRPDLILLDVMLRGLSGFDICRRFRAAPGLSDIPVILLTVWEEAGVATTGREAGAALTLRKPDDPQVVLAAIEQVLRERSDPARE